jgi:sulfate-transporting ATPase
LPPPSDADVTKLSGWRAPSRGAVPAPALDAGSCCCWTNPRITWTRSRSRGSSEPCRSTAGTVVAITHDRYFLDNAASWISGTRPRSRYSLGGQLLVVAGAEAGSTGVKRKSPTRSVKRHSSANSSGSACRRELVRVKARPGLMRLQRTCGRVRSRAERRADRLEIAIPPGPRLGDVVVNAANSDQGLRRATAHGGSHVPASSGRHCRGDRRQRGRKDDAVSSMMVGLESNRYSGTIDHWFSTVSFAYVDQSRDNLSAGRTPSLTRSARAKSAWWSATARFTPARTWRVSVSKVVTNRRRSARSPAANATACNSRKVLRSGGNVLAARRTDQ